MSPSPLIGITAGLAEPDLRTRRAYAEAVARAGGIPILLPCVGGDAATLAAHHADRIDAAILTGGDDPTTEPFGAPTHPEANPIPPERQAYEIALLAELRARDTPSLGICLGMQLMALTAGGRLNQYLPDDTPTHADHMDDRRHPIVPEPILSNPIHAGEVTSWHRQAVTDPGTMRTTARAHDTVIEAIDDPTRTFFLGVQWHPERTTHRALGQALFDALAQATQAVQARH
ncbi:MAG: gamma-glutamyl-gamma-aminobutyrate hydrolase family protein [Planctomycetota bacterium]